MDQPKAQTQERRKAAPLLASCVIFLVALNLRPAIVAVGPLLSSIGATFGWGESIQGLLGSLPLLAFALFSLIVGALTAKLDSNKVLFWALIALAGGCIVRSLSGESMVWLGTLVIGASIAVGNVLAPAIVKRDFIDNVSFATGAYSACVTAGSALAGLTASAAADALGGWQPALAFWAIPALLAAFLWLLRTKLARDIESNQAGEKKQRWQNAPRANVRKHEDQSPHQRKRTDKIPASRVTEKTINLACHALHGASICSVLHLRQLASRYCWSCWFFLRRSRRAPLHIPGARHRIGPSNPTLHVSSRQSSVRRDPGKRAVASRRIGMAPEPAPFPSLEYFWGNGARGFASGGAYPYLPARKNPRRNNCPFGFCSIAWLPSCRMRTLCIRRTHGNNAGIRSALGIYGNPRHGSMRAVAFRGSDPQRSVAFTHCVCRETPNMPNCARPTRFI